jgi:hypothetical protein
MEKIKIAFSKNEFQKNFDRMIDLPRFYPNLTDATPFNPLLHPLTLGFSKFCYNVIKRALLIAFGYLFLNLFYLLTLPQGRT